MRAAQFLISERYRYVCIGVPKVASTTLLELFVGWHAGPQVAPHGARSCLRKPGVRRLLADAGFHQLWARDGQITDLVQRHRGYFFFCFVRNPYSRLVSCYSDKLNRYARAFVRPVYYFGKLGQLTALYRGPDASHRRALSCMKYWIGFPEFVRGLARHGVEFDTHFMCQSDITCPDLIPYDYVGKLETFDEDLAEIKRRVGLAGAGGGGDTPPIKKNATAGRSSRPVCYTDALRSIVSDLYRTDFENFDYPA
jgi:hypothetical protein